MKTKMAPREITITGVVNEIEVDDSGKVAVCITADDEDYLVEMNPVGKELAELVDEEVEVTGILSTDGDGNLTIRASGFEILEAENYEDRSYEEEFLDGYDADAYAEDDSDDEAYGDGGLEVYEEDDHEKEEDDDYDGAGRKKPGWDN